jgi:hypothetical protein
MKVVSLKIMPVSALQQQQQLSAAARPAMQAFLFSLSHLDVNAHKLSRLSPPPQHPGRRKRVKELFLSEQKYTALRVQSRSANKVTVLLSLLHSRAESGPRVQIALFL